LKNQIEIMDESNSPKRKFLTFQIENELYAIDIDYVIDINRIQEITDVPNQEPYIKGIINLRGQIVPVIDIRQRFNKMEREYDDRTCIVVLNYRESIVGAIVDRVEEVMSVSIDNISKPKSIEDKSRFVWGITKIGEMMLTIMDVEKLLFD